MMRDADAISRQFGRSIAVHTRSVLLFSLKDRARRPSTYTATLLIITRAASYLPTSLIFTPIPVLTNSTLLQRLKFTDSSYASSDSPLPPNIFFTPVLLYSSIQYKSRSVILPSTDAHSLLFK